jgi:hypothetical protein
MTEDKLKNLLQNADQNAGNPSPARLDISIIHKRAKRRQIYHLVYPAAAAAIVIIAISIWSLSGKKTELIEAPKQIATNNIEVKIKLLQVSTDETIKLIHDIIEQEDRQRRINKLEAELAAIPDPIEEINEQLDRTAFILVYSADRMYNELNLTDSAIDTYKRVIKLFPENQWAKVARERLEEIKNKRNNNDSSKGESKWKPQNTLS